MAYTKTTWQDLPNTTTPINATNLNKIENGIEAIDNDVSTINNNISTINNNIGDLTDLETSDTSSIVNSINELKSAEVYSTNEVKTNSIWIDGKPIYRKVIQMSNVAAGTTGTYNISNLNISNVWIDFGKSFYKSGALSLPLNRTHTGSTNSQSEARVSPTTISLICGSGISAENPVITINYTKTTD